MAIIHREHDAPTSTSQDASLTSRDGILRLDGLSLPIALNRTSNDEVSIVIRVIDPEGVPNTSFLQVGESVRVVPMLGGFVNSNRLADRALVPSRAAARAAIPSHERVGSSESFVKRSLPLRSLSVFAAGAKYLMLGALLTLLVLQFLGVVSFRTILSGSMEPELSRGDVILSISTNVVEPRIGDIVIYTARDLQGQPVTLWSHRIIDGDSTQGFTIKGDANPDPDLGIVNRSDVRFIVVATLPKVGFLLQPFLFIASGLILLILAWRLRGSLQRS